jgi:hypothetical protein
MKIKLISSAFGFVSRLCLRGAALAAREAARFDGLDMTKVKGETAIVALVATRREAQALLMRRSLDMLGAMLGFPINPLDMPEGFKVPSEAKAGDVGPFGKPYPAGFNPLTDPTPGCSCPACARKRAQAKPAGAKAVN